THKLHTRCIARPQQEVAEVGASYEQHESHGGLQHPKNAPRRANNLVLQRFHLHHVLTRSEYVSARANALTPARDQRPELPFGLLRRDVSLQTSEDREKVARAILAYGRSKLKWQPQFDVAGPEGETRRDDADDIPRHAVDLAL